MKRLPMLVTYLVLALAPAANAAVSVTLDADAPYYPPGSTITLSVHVTQVGGETDNAVFGAINYDASKVTPGTRTQNALPPGSVPGAWSLGALTCTTTFCVAFSQIHPAGPTSVGVTNFLISTVTFTVRTDIAAWPLTFDFQWRTTPTTQRLDFYGITDAPGVSITYIPEPTTAALLALGLAGLAGAARGRRAAAWRSSRAETAMKRVLILVAWLGLVPAPAANAAVSVTLSSDKPYSTYAPGELLTLEVRVTADAGELDDAVFGAINYPNSQVDPIGRSQAILPPGDWLQGSTNCTTVFCTAFSQIRSAGATAVGVTDFLIATLTFQIEWDEGGQLIQFSWRTAPTSQRLDFFGVTNAPSYTIVAAGEVPEPTTAALLALGLAGLALARRPRA